MLNPIEKFKVAILHLNRDWNHRILMVGMPLRLTSIKKRVKTDGDKIL